MQSYVPFDYSNDPFLSSLYHDVQKAGPLRAITLDITHDCNLKCQGCYFFSEDMNRFKPPSEEEVARFIVSEKKRGTTFISVLGGEPSLMPTRLKKFHDNFQILTFTNGLKKIPYKGFENMSIALSLWGDSELDKKMRGSGRIDVFSKALKNYRNDPRVIWYYTTSPGNHKEIEIVTEKCINNGNYLQFSYYEDRKNLGGDFSDSQGFEKVKSEIDQMIFTYPEKILTTSYVNHIATTGTLFNQTWGYDVCPTISTNCEKNTTRLQNGYPFIKHFRAYYPDLKTIRRCCIGEDHDCSVCYNNWAKITWIVVNKKQHMKNIIDYTKWLTTLYTMYLFAGAISLKKKAHMLKEIHKRVNAYVF